MNLNTISFLALVFKARPTKEEIITSSCMVCVLSRIHFPCGEVARKKAKVRRG
jgi:hypothetical protein